MIDNAAFGKTLKNVRKHRYIKLATTERRRHKTLTVYIKTDDIYKDIAENVEAKFNTSNYELDRPLTKGKNKKVIELMKDELGGKIMRKFVEIKAKTYSYLIDDSSDDKTAKDKKSVS